MSRAELIYPIQKGIERELRRVENDSFNSEILVRYYKVRTTQARRTTILADFIRLNQISKMLNKKFEDATVQDIENLIFEIDGLKNADSTKNKYRKVLKAFYRWMRRCAPREYPPEVKWITLKKVPMVTVTPLDIPSFEMAVRITECASNLRDKALFQCKLDAGCRIGEVLTPKIKEVEFNDVGAIIHADGKTGKAPLILTWSAKILTQWLNAHPFKNNPDAPLWPTFDRSEPLQLSYAAALRAFQKCVKKSGYPKRMWPHLLKHVSSTEDSEKGLSDSYKRYKHHWTPNSRMPQVYEHLSNSVIRRIQNETWDKVIGIKKESDASEKPVEVLKKCKRCEFENPRDSLYCNRCAFPLAEMEQVMEKRIKLQQMLHSLIADPQELENLRSYLAERRYEKNS